MPAALPWDAARALLDPATNIIAVTHVAPDGDAIGSLLALTYALRRLGKNVTPAVDGGVPDNLRFLPGASQVSGKLKGIQANLVISLDASDVQRIGEVGKQALDLGTPVIMVDHHRTNTLFGTVNLLDAEATATAEVLVDWLDALGAKLTKTVAYCLLTGIVTDTLCFRVNSVTPNTLAKAHRLMLAGASLPKITQHTVNRRSTSALRLWSKALPTLKVEDHTLWVVADKAALEAAQYTEEGGAGGLVQLLNETDDGHVAAVFREKSDGAVELHLRAQPGYDVSTLAKNLGGGGHMLAAGATVPGPLAETVERIVPLLKAAANPPPTPSA